MSLMSITVHSHKAKVQVHGLTIPLDERISMSVTRAQLLKLLKMSDDGDISIGVESGHDLFAEVLRGR